MENEDKLESLFMLEFLVEDVHIDTKNIPETFMHNLPYPPPLRVSISFMSFDPLEVCQRDFCQPDSMISSPSKIFVKMNCGKSLLFPLSDKELNSSVKDPLYVVVFRKFYSETYIVGVTNVIVQQLWSEIAKELLCKGTGNQISRKMEGCYTLRTEGGENEVGAVSLFLRITYIGKSTFTLFQSSADKTCFIYKHGPTRPSSANYRDSRTNKSNGRSSPRRVCTNEPTDSIDPQDDINVVSRACENIDGWRNVKHKLILNKCLKNKSCEELVQGKNFEAISNVQRTKSDFGPFEAQSIAFRRSVISPGLVHKGSTFTRRSVAEVKSFSDQTRPELFVYDVTSAGESVNYNFPTKCFSSDPNLLSREYKHILQIGLLQNTSGSKSEEHMNTDESLDIKGKSRSTPDFAESERLKYRKKYSLVGSSSPLSGKEMEVKEKKLQFPSHLKWLLSPDFRGRMYGEDWKPEQVNFAVYVISANDPPPPEEEGDFPEDEEEGEGEGEEEEIMPSVETKEIEETTVKMRYHSGVYNISVNTETKIVVVGAEPEEGSEPVKLRFYKTGEDEDSLADLSDFEIEFTPPPVPEEVPVWKEPVQLVSNCTQWYDSDLVHVPIYKGEEPKPGSPKKGEGDKGKKGKPGKKEFAEKDTEVELADFGMKAIKMRVRRKPDDADKGPAGDNQQPQT